MADPSYATRLGRHAQDLDADGHDTFAVSVDAIIALGFVGPILIADTHSTPLVFADLVQNEDEDDLVYQDL